MKKFYLDVILLIIFMLVMSFHLLPKLLHEILGMLIIPLVIYHLYWNFKAFKLLKGTPKKRLSLFIDIALFLCLFIIMFTGICISRHLFNDMIDISLQRNIIIHQLHSAVPFLFIILSGIHFGLNWQGFWQRINIILKLDTNNKFYKFTSRLLIIILIAAGIYGSFLNQIGDRLLMEHIFATEMTSLPFVEFIFLMFGIFSLYVVIGFIISKYIN